MTHKRLADVTWFTSQLKINFILCEMTDSDLENIYVAEVSPGACKTNKNMSYKFVWFSWLLIDRWLGSSWSHARKSLLTGMYINIEFQKGPLLYCGSSTPVQVPKHVLVLRLW